MVFPLFSVPGFSVVPPGWFVFSEVPEFPGVSVSTGFSVFPPFSVPGFSVFPPFSVPGFSVFPPFSVPGVSVVFPPG